MLGQILKGPKSELFKNEGPKLKLEEKKKKGKEKLLNYFPCLSAYPKNLPSATETNYTLH